MPRANKKKTLERHKRQREIWARFHIDEQYVWEIAEDYGMRFRMAKKIALRPVTGRPLLLKQLLPGLNALFGTDYAKREAE